MLANGDYTPIVYAAPKEKNEMLRFTLDSKKGILVFRFPRLFKYQKKVLEMAEW